MQAASPELLADALGCSFPSTAVLQRTDGTGLLQAPCTKNSQKGLSALDQLAAWEGLVGSEVAHLVKVTLYAASP